MHIITPTKCIYFFNKKIYRYEEIHQNNFVFLLKIEILYVFNYLLDFQT